MIFKVSPAGVVTNQFSWDSSTPGNPSGDQPLGLALDGQGNVYVCGLAGIPYTAQASTDFLVLKLNASLQLQWTRRTVGNFQTKANAIACGPNGEAYVAGVIGVLGSPLLNGLFTVIRYDTDGTLAWTRTALDASHPAGQAISVAVDSRGDVLVAGHQGQIPWYGDALIQKYDPLGNLVWTQTFVQNGHQILTGMDVDEGGDVLATGRAWSTAAPPYALRYDRDGHLTWTTFGEFGVLHHGTGGSSYLAARAIAPAGYAVSTLSRLDANVIPVCFGDGSGTACPCGNASAVGDRSGCTNSLGLAGRLGHDGMASLSNDSLVLLGSGMPDSAALYFQGTSATNGGAGALFGDGLRCVGGSIVRLGAVANTAHASQYPSGLALPVSVKGQVGAPGSRTYQVRYRNTAGFCTSDTFNMTNALEVAWAP
jgi:hypothetical protein